MSEIKQVWGIIKNYQCADLKIVQDPALAVFQHQQAIIDEHTEVIKLQDADLRKYEKQIESLKAQLNNMETCYIEKKKECEGLQKTNISLEAGLRKNSKNKQKLLGKNIELQKRVDGALFEMQQLSLMLSKDIDGYEDPAQICQSEGVDMGVKILEKALRGANETN